jgi:hypothetical protein
MLARQALLLLEHGLLDPRHKLITELSDIFHWPIPEATGSRKIYSISLQVKLHSYFSKVMNIEMDEELN